MLINFQLKRFIHYCLLLFNFDFVINSFFLHILAIVGNSNTRQMNRGDYICSGWVLMFFFQLRLHVLFLRVVIVIIWRQTVFLGTWNFLKISNLTIGFNLSIDKIELRHLGVLFYFINFIFIHTLNPLSFFDEFILERGFAFYTNLLDLRVYASNFEVLLWCWLQGNILR